MCDSRQVPFNIRHEDGNANTAEILGNHSETNRLARAGGAGNQTMAVGHSGQ
jgi:hypothetical protein